MYPVIHIFGLNLYPYGLMLGIGLVLAIFVFMKRCNNRGFDEDSAFNLAVTAGICGILGAKLFFIIFEFPEIIKDPILIITDFSNGFVLYGGVIIGILVGFIYAKVIKWPFIKILDIAVPSISLAQAFGRLGCLFAGCCYGKETNSFLGIELNNSPYAPHNVHLLPTQIISSLGDLIIFSILLWFDNKKKKRDGQTGALYLIIYSIGRFSVEFLRGDPRGTILNILSTSQFISIFIFAAGLILFFIVTPKFKAEVIQDAVVKENNGLNENHKENAVVEETHESKENNIESTDVEEICDAKDDHIKNVNEKINDNDKSENITNPGDKKVDEVNNNK